MKLRENLKSSETTLTKIFETSLRKLVRESSKVPNDKLEECLASLEKNLTPKKYFSIVSAVLNNRIDSSLKQFSRFRSFSDNVLSYLT